MKALGLKYGIDETTDSSVIEKKVVAYLTLHYLEVHKWFGDLNDLWQAGNYKQTGFNAAGYAHKVLGLTPEIIKQLISAWNWSISQIYKLTVNIMNQKYIVHSNHPFSLLMSSLEALA